MTEAVLAERLAALEAKVDAILENVKDIKDACPGCRSLGATNQTRIVNLEHQVDSLYKWIWGLLAAAALQVASYVLKGGVVHVVK